MHMIPTKQLTIKNKEWYTINALLEGDKLNLNMKINSVVTPIFKGNVDNMNSMQGFLGLGVNGTKAGFDSLWT